MAPHRLHERCVERIGEIEPTGAQFALRGQLGEVVERLGGPGRDDALVRIVSRDGQRRKLGDKLLGGFARAENHRHAAGVFGQFLMATTIIDDLYRVGEGQHACCFRGGDFANAMAHHQRRTNAEFC